MRTRTVIVLSVACLGVGAGAATAVTQIGGSESAPTRSARCVEVGNAVDALWPAWTNAWGPGNSIGNYRPYRDTSGGSVIDRLDHQFAVLVANDPACYPPAAVAAAQRSIAER